MADTRCQTECERWVRDVWLADQFGQRFSERNVTLTSGGQFKFDAVSADGSILASISTSRAAMSSGKRGVGKLMKLRADMLFHMLAAAPRKLMVFTEPCMYQACSSEQVRGRTPQDIEFVLVQLPPELATKLAASRDRSSREVRPTAVEPSA
jgi:hypothetical protein